MPGEERGRTPEEEGPLAAAAGGGGGLRRPLRAAGAWRPGRPVGVASVAAWLGPWLLPAVVAGAFAAFAAGGGGFGGRH